MALFCIISKIKLDIGQKSRFFIPYLHLTARLGVPIVVLEVIRYLGHVKKM